MSRPRASSRPDRAGSPGGLYEHSLCGSPTSTSTQRRPPLFVLNLDQVRACAASRLEQPSARPLHSALCAARKCKPTARRSCRCPRRIATRFRERAVRTTARPGPSWIEPGKKTRILRRAVPPIVQPDVTLCARLSTARSSPAYVNPGAEVQGSTPCCTVLELFTVGRVGTRVGAGRCF